MEEGRDSANIGKLTLARIAWFHNYSVKSLAFCKTSLRAYFVVVRQKLREDLSFCSMSFLRLKVSKAQILFSFGKDIPFHVI